MNHFRCLLPILVLFGSVTGSLSCRADDDASRLAAATELVQAMNSERTLHRATEQMSQGADKLMPPGGRTSATPEEEAAFRVSLRQQAKEIIDGQLNWQTMQPELAKMYADNFTEPELKQLIEFYKTPLGQKLSEKQPDLNSKFGLLSQQKIRSATPALMQKLRASITKFHTDHPAPTPTPAASPATSPGAASTPAGSPGRVTAVSPPVSAPPAPAVAVTPTPAAASPTPSTPQ